MSAQQLKRLAKTQAEKLIFPKNKQTDSQEESEPIETNNENSLLDENLTDLCDISFSDSEGEAGDIVLCEGLAQWATEFEISFGAINALLLLLLKCSIKVPKDASTLLETGAVSEDKYIPADGFQSPLAETQGESSKSLMSEISDMKKLITELKEGNERSFAKLTKEVIAVKLENRNHHAETIVDDKDFQKLPFADVSDLEEFNEEVQVNEDKLRQFKQFIAKTGGEGTPQFLRAAVRKVFTDELASSYSWKGTTTKPSAEKSFLITTIKNICHLKYGSTDKDMNAVLQKHFVHAKDRLLKRKRPN